MPTRLQKRIAESGLMSRRSAEQVISDGRVSVNGHIAVLGECVEEKDEVCIDGQMIPLAEEKRYYLMNKPRGYVCTMHDEQGRRSVRELLPAEAGRVYPVGRLDIMSEGLLLMTNDGDFALRMTHPSREQMKTYRTTVQGTNLKLSIQRLQEDFFLDGVTVRAKHVTLLSLDGDRAVLLITIGEGRNRQIRRMCEIAQMKVTRLERVSEGPFQLGDLPTGQVRRLTVQEIASVMEERKP